MGANFDVDYRREFGIHKFEAIDGVQVTAISANHWGEFESIADSLLPQTAGYVITPELITTDLVPMGEVPRRNIEILNREGLIKQLSRSNPDATVLLGSPRIEDSASRNAYSSAQTWRNSLHLIQAGKTIGYIDKQPDPQRGWPVSSEKLRTSQLKTGYSALLCSDIIFSGVAAGRPDAGAYMPPTTKTLLLSSAWAIKMSGEDIVGRTPENRFRGQLEHAIGTLLCKYPNLMEVIMTDRSTEDFKLPPFNAHFRRSTTT